MSKSKFFTVVIILGISAIILYGIIYFTFNNNKINQGNFRISDSILSSIIELEDKSEDTNQWKYDISQNNKISMLVQTIGDATLKEIYLENVKVKSKNDVNIYIEQDNYGLELEYSKIKNKKVNIYIEETETGAYLVEFDIKNKNIVSDFNVSNDIKEIRHDGTILNIAGMPVSQTKFNIKYNLVIVQDNNRINTCKIKFEMPDEKIAVDGFFVQRLDSSNYNFKVSY